MTTAEKFREATKACEHAGSSKAAPADKKVLIGAAVLFAQVAEHIERGNFLTGEILERCRIAISLIGDDQMRRKIEVLLFDA